MVRRGALVVVLVLCLAPLGVGASAAPAGGRAACAAGAPGVGDPYFPLDGNGGYDVGQYVLDLGYDPPTDLLEGRAVIVARATQGLSSFNLDLQGLEVRSISVNGRAATWSREGNELTVTPGRCVEEGRRFVTIVTYDGVPETLEDGSGFIHTDDGALVVGEPDVAATWFPVNDHPSDKAAYLFNVTVPEGLEAVANGVLLDQRTRDGSTTWTWRAKEPMAAYLATATIGEFDLRAYEVDGIRYWDAIDPDLFAQVGPRTGERYALSQAADLTYKRLTRTVSVPAGAGELSFWVTRDTEPGWDYFFVEARTAGTDDWTTLPDANGHTSQDTGSVCPYWHGLHPFLTRYQTPDEGEGCTPSGTSGEWWAASGSSDGYEQWVVDLSAYAGTDVEVSLSYASDDSVQATGVYVDDVVVSAGAGSTSFEDDGDTLDGWTVPGAPEGSAANANDWIAGTVADAPPPIGEQVEASLARQPEIIEFLSDVFGPYPFSAAGGIVDDYAELGFALENQTRPIYSPGFFGTAESGDSVVVHELAHQWYGDSLAVQAWQHIWLNEGFATYAEWLWSEREGLGTTQEIFDDFATIPAEDAFWALAIGDPGPDALFDGAVYGRGAMTLHALRLEVGDRDFFRILRRWARTESDGNVTTDEFIALAERVSGEQLDELFEVWLFTPAKPPGLPEEPAGGAAAVTQAAPGAGARSRSGAAHR